MEANKMFGEIGYFENTNDEREISFKSDEHGEPVVQFLFKDKTYFVWEDDELNGYTAPKVITVVLHKAITQQLKELGWLND